MDLILLVFVLALVGFCVWIITTKVPMPPYWATVIQLIAVLMVVLFLIRRLGGLPNIL